jgi:8-oxo-dGTP pyrophosphatase MutT (NUDIX family)
MLQNLRDRLTSYTPRRFSSDQPKASVLIALTDHPSEPEVILTQRSVHLSSHSGEVAFPGGKHDLTDPDLLYTALREAEEEVGLNPEQVDVIAPLGQVMSKNRLQVTPWVGIVPHDVSLKANPDELDAIFRVPLTYLMSDPRRRTDAIRLTDVTHYVPAWEFEGYLIWGLTAYMLAELLNVGFDAQIPMKPRPEHR